MAGDGVRIAIACEDQAHRSLATFLADRVILDEAARSADWIDEASLDWYRTYCGRGDTDEHPPHRRFYPLSQASRDAEGLAGQRVGGRPIRIHGHINGKPLRPEASFWRRVFMLFAVAGQPPDALIVAHDTDGDLDRIEDLEQALELSWSFPIIVATPHQDAEAWFMAGLAPMSEAEKRRLQELRDELGFHPHEQPERLTAHPNDARTDAKRVLRVVMFDEDESRPPSLEELPELCSRTLTDLALLERRGEACRLNAFLRTLRAVLVPLLIPRRPPGS